MQWLLFPLVFIVGALNALQTGANTKLAETSGAPIVAAMAVVVVGLLTLLAMSPLFGFGDHALVRMQHAPWWAWIGGIGNALYITAILFAAQKLGAGAFSALTVTAAILTSIALDHFGLLGMEQHAAGPWRLLGGGLMIAGVMLVARF